MPVTKTAKRALRGSKRKLALNNLLRKRLEVSIRTARKTKKKEHVLAAISLADIAAKRKVLHKNKSSRIKSSLSKIEISAPKKTTTKTVTKKSSK
jgi:ribosomal protein S20